MKRGLPKRLLAVLLVLSMLLAYALPTYAAEDKNSLVFEQVSNSLLPSPIKDAAVEKTDAKEYKDSDIVRVSIFLNGKSTLDAGYSTQNIADNAAAMHYQQNLAITQTAVEERINRRLGEKLDIVWNLTLVANVISANVEYGQIETIKKVPGVSDVVLECAYEAATGTESDAAAPNGAISTGMTGASAAWQSGYTGAGSKIAIIDTGLDLMHQSVDEGAFLHAVGENADLMDESDIAEVFDKLHIATEAGEAENLYVNAKVPFAFNYVDLDDDVSHVNDAQGEHGSHVAGIAAANRFIPDGNGGYKDALESVYAAGTAPDAQLVIMKVFGKGGGAYDSDYMVAIEDAIMLGCDSVNLSLGSGMAGFVTSEEYQDIFDSLAESDTVVTISAGNSGHWAEQSDVGLLYHDDVNWATDGSPGSYANAFTVASVDNYGRVSPAIYVGDKPIFYMEYSGNANKPLETLANGDSVDGVEYDYVFLASVGAVVDVDADGNPLVDEEGNYTLTQEGTFNDFDKLTRNGVDLTNKIVLCFRGTSSFSVKADLAMKAGAAAVLIVNNEPGGFNMVVESKEDKPVALLLMDDAEYFAAAGTPAQIGDGDDSLIYFSGTMTVKAFGVMKDTDDHYTMSDFSSWGVPSDLSLKPEITAPGGNIYSINGTHKENGEELGGTDAYELMSGTSMAAPQVAGLSAIVQQYIRDKHLTDKLLQPNMTDRALTQSLLMSTAEPMWDADGNYYPVFQQGAGLADVNNAINAPTYVLMSPNATPSYADGKVKAELGANTTGTYQFSFTLNNLTSTDLEYNLSADVFTQDYTQDKYGVYSYTSTTDLSYFGMGPMATVSFGSGDSVTVPANGSVRVDVTIQLTESAKYILDTLSPNGAYVEAYVFAQPETTTEGVKSVTHSIPVLGYYGNWGNPSMFDRITAFDLVNLSCESFDFQPTGNSWNIPYLYSLHRGLTNFFYDTKLDWIVGTNPVADDTNYKVDRAAISSSSSIGEFDFTLIRNAGASRLTVKAGEETLIDQELGPIYAAYYSDNAQAWKNIVQGITMDLGLEGLAEGTEITATFTAVPEYFVKDGKVDWEAAAQAAGTTVTAITHIDDTAPKISDIEEGDGSITVSAWDNRYIAGILVWPSDGEAEEPVIRYAPCTDGVGDWTGTIPMAEVVEDADGNEESIPLEPGVYMIQVVDYAGNMATYRLFYKTEPTSEVAEVTINPKALSLAVNGSSQVTASVQPVTLSDRGVNWSTSDAAIATVDENGVVTGVSEGTCTITATSKMDETKSASCLVSIVLIDETLNSLVWDENGDIWWSAFNTADLPNYTKLTDQSVEAPQLASVTYGPDDKLYALSMDEYNGSNLYSVDEKTLETTLIGPCGVWFADMAYVPTLDMLVGIEEYFIVGIDAKTGAFNQSFMQMPDESLNFVGITYAGTSYSEDNTQVIDELYLVTDEGDLYTYQLKFDATTHALVGQELSEGTHIGDPVDSLWFQSLYCTDSYLYWSRFNEADDCVELIAVDRETEDVYSLGYFADKVWPVGGLFQLAEHEHQFTDTVTAPTCTAEGYTTHTCSECGYSYTDTKVPATGHELGEWKSDENGHYHECAKCGAKLDEAGHDYKWVVDKEATATEKGSKHQECSVCGHKTAAVDIPAKGSSAQTGDSMHLALWISLLTVSATGLAVLVLFSRKRKIAE